MRVIAVISQIFSGFRVALHGETQHGEVWIGEFAGRWSMISELHKIGIINNKERAAIAQHDFTHDFATKQATVDMLDAITAGFLPYGKEPIR